MKFDPTPLIRSSLVFFFFSWPDGSRINRVPLYIQTSKRGSSSFETNNASKQMYMGRSLRSKRFRLLLCVLVLVNGARGTFSAKVGARACLPQPSRSQKAEMTFARTENPSHIPYGNTCYPG